MYNHTIVLLNGKFLKIKNEESEIAMSAFLGVPHYRIVTDGKLHVIPFSSVLLVESEEVK